MKKRLVLSTSNGTEFEMLLDRSNLEQMLVPDKSNNLVVNLPTGDTIIIPYHALNHLYLWSELVAEGASV